MIHLGWTIALDQHAPVTGRWKATKHGVQMGAGTYGALVKMIERKVQEGYWPAAWRRPVEAELGGGGRIEMVQFYEAADARVEASRRQCEHGGAWLVLWVPRVEAFVIMAAHRRHRLTEPADITEVLPCKAS